MNTKAKIFIGVGIAIFLGGIAYFTKDKWMPLFKKNDGDTPTPDGGDDNKGGDTPDTTYTNKPNEGKPAYPPKDAGQQGAKPSGKWATISVVSQKTPLWQNLSDINSKIPIIEYPYSSNGKVLGEIINTANDKSGTTYYYIKFDTKVIKYGKNYWNGWVNSKLVSVK